jgi:hypothetical protein
MHATVAMHLRMPIPKNVSRLPATATLPAVPALPATATLPAVATLPATATQPATATLPAVATLPATAMLPAVATLPATSMLPAVAIEPVTDMLPAVESDDDNSFRNPTSQSLSARHGRGNSRRGAFVFDRVAVNCHQLVGR